MRRRCNSFCFHNTSKWFVMVDTVLGSSKREDCPRETDEEGEVVGDPENDDWDDVESYKCNSPKGSLWFNTKYSIAITLICTGSLLPSAALTSRLEGPPAVNSKRPIFLESVDPAYWCDESCGMSPAWLC